MRTYPIAEIKTDVSTTSSLQNGPKLNKTLINNRHTDRALHWYFDFPPETETDAVRQTTWPDSVVTEREKNMRGSSRHQTNRPKTIITEDETTNFHLVLCAGWEVL